MEDSPEAEIGADVDAASLLSELRSEIENRRAGGRYPAELVAPRPDPDRLALALENLVAAASFSATPALSGGRVGRTVKRALQPAMRWYVSQLVEQQERFAAATVAVLALMAERLNEVVPVEPPARDPAG